VINATKPVVYNSSHNVEKALALLTGREKEVALEAAKGLSNKVIARGLSITERTVKAHISATLEKLGVKDRLQLALVLNDRVSDLRQGVKKSSSTITPFKQQSFIKVASKKHFWNQAKKNLNRIA